MAKMGRAALVRMEKQLLRLGRGLNGERFAIQIGKLRDAAVRHYGDDLTADHVGAGPAVLVLAPIHAEAAPDAVDLAVREQILLHGPVNELKIHLIAEAAEGLRGQLHIDSDRGAARPNVAVGRVSIHADTDHRTVISRGICLPCAASGQYNHR